MKKVSHEPSDLIKHSNAVVTARYNMSQLAIKTFLLAYSKLTPQDSGFYQFEFSESEVRKILGEPVTSKKQLWSKMKSIQKEGIEICEGGRYVSHIPLPSIDWNLDAKTITFHLNPAVKPHFLNLKAQYTMFPVEHAFRLYGRYSIRMYQLVMLWQGKEREDHTWDLELEVRELRTMWGIGEEEYKLMASFRRDVIERAIMEINSAQLGILLTMLPPRKNGKNITHFIVQARRIQASEPRHVNPKPATKTEEDALKLKEKHPEKWQGFYDFAMKQEALFSIDREAEASAYADSELKKWAGNKTKKATEDKV